MNTRYLTTAALFLLPLGTVACVSGPKQAAVGQTDVHRFAEMPDVEMPDVELATEIGSRALTMQVLAADGVPLDREKIQARFWSASGNDPKRPFGPVFNVKPDREGVITVTYEGRLDEQHPRKLHLVRQPDASFHPDQPDWSRVIVGLPECLSRGAHHDLGIVRLEEPAVLQEGVVIDDQGRPVQSARVHFTTGEWGKRTKGRRERSFSRTDAEGRFRLRAFETASKLSAIVGTGSSYTSPSDPVPKGRHYDLDIGARGVQLSLAPTGDD